MTYRSDLEAAQARADSAERRANRLQLQLADSTTTALAVRPAKFAVSRSDHDTRIAWPHRSRNWLGFLAGALTFDAFIAYALVTSGVSVSLLLAAAAALLMTYWGIGACVNRTTILASPTRLEIETSPVDLGPKLTIDPTQVQQLYVVRQGDEAADRWRVSAMMADDTERELVHNLERDEAIFVERTIESALGILDRPVAGEDRSRRFELRSA